MTRTAALKLARYLSALGCEASVRRHSLPGDRYFYTVQRIDRRMEPRRDPGAEPRVAKARVPFLDLNEDS